MHRSPQQNSDSTADSMARLTDATGARNVYFYKDGDTTVGALRLAVNPRKYRSMDSLLSDLSRKIPGLSFGVRSIYTPRGHDVVRDVENLEKDGRYVCSTYKNRARGIDVLKAQPPAPWHAAKPSSGQRQLNNLIRNGIRFDEEQAQRSPRPPFRPPPAKRRYVYANTNANSSSQQGTDSSGSRTTNAPKRIVLIRNTDHSEKHVLLLNRRTLQNFEHVLVDMSGVFRMAVRRLFTLEGMRIHSLSAILNGPEHYIVCGKEKFRSFDEVYAEGQRKPNQRTQNGKGGGLTVADYLKEKRERLSRTRGKWRVWITTSEIPKADTAAQVSLTVYGDKGNSGPIPLGDADGETFQAGQVDEFESLKDKTVLQHGEISAGNIGFIYKIRVSHDNSGDYPGWFCEEVVMRDIHTDEELIFRCNRWLSRDDDDMEISRELPAVRSREPVLPIVKYHVTVVTGDYWNAGTNSHIYMTIYGDRGDTGVRQLIKAAKSTHPFQKGQADVFQIEAVTLGALRRVIIGHDGNGPNNGWYLEKVVILEGELAYEECVFPCGRWLDEGEDDGKIVRELKIQDEYMHDQLEREMWEYEKWKYGPQCQVMLFSKLTKKAIRLRSDGQVDGLGEVESDETILNVFVRKGSSRMLQCAANGKFLAINDHRIISQPRHGPTCELKLKVQPDRSVKLQSLKYNLQYISIRKDGHAADPRASQSDPSASFLAYCKGMFRADGTIMLCTSMTQTVAIQHDNKLYGTGKRNSMAHFIVHKVSDDNIRMFESACFPDHYIRMRDGECDCQGTGDSYCHFRVHRYREMGFVTLESMASRGLFVGLTPDGSIRPTVDTGDKNVRLFPEVLKFGRPKSGEQQTFSPEFIPLSPRTPTPPPKTRTPRKKEKQIALQVNLRDKSTSPERSRSRSRSRSPVRKSETPLKRKSKTPVKEKEKSIFEAGDWKVWIETTETAVDGEVAMVLYGSKGSSGSIALGSTRDNKLFQSGRTDEFKVNLVSIGEIYKIRLELNPIGKGDIPTWQVRELRMQDQDSKEVLKFKFNRWLSCLHDNLELVKELPVIRPKQEILPVVSYLVETFTGDEAGSDTDARVYVTLYGERGDTGKRLLNRGDLKCFQESKVDLFEIEAVSLGKLTHCFINHDGGGPGEGWYCKQIVVKETEEAEMEYVFLCNRWLDSSVDDKKTERMLDLAEERPVVSEQQEEEVEENEAGDWRIWLLTGKESNMGVSGSVILYAYGDNYHIGPIIVGSGGEDMFEPGNMDEFKINLSPSMGDLYKIRIGHDELDESGWYLEKIKMKNLNSKELLTFNVNRWMSRDRDDREVWRELPVIRPGQTPLTVITYSVSVHTGSSPGSDTEANIYMNIFGSRGDCGMRNLYKNVNGGKKFQRGGVDVFHIEGVDLGSMEKILIGHDGEGPGAGWYLEKIVISEANDGGDGVNWFFPCEKWFDEGMDDKLLSREIESVRLTDYRVVAETRDGASSGAVGQVAVILCGRDAESKAIPLIKDNVSPLYDVLAPGEVDKFDIDSKKELGPLLKLKVGWENPRGEVSWSPKKITIRNKSDPDVCYEAFFDDPLFGGKDKESWTEITLNKKD